MWFGSRKGEAGRALGVGGGAGASRDVGMVGEGKARQRLFHTRGLTWGWLRFGQQEQTGESFSTGAAPASCSPIFFLPSKRMSS